MGSWTSFGRLLVATLLLASACSSEQIPAAPASPSPPQPPAPTGPPIRILMLTATTGFRHDGAIAAARDVVPRLGASGEFVVTATEDVSSITASTLSNVDVLFFAMTTGELPFSADQKRAIMNFISNGGGFIGTHSATDTLYEWPEYGELIGAYFKEHPWTGQASVLVEDPSHPSTAGLGDRFSIMEEFYTFRENPRPRVQVILRLDAASVGASGDYPLAWSHSQGNGRAYYNALGHFDETWRDQRFQRQITGAIRWLARR